RRISNVATIDADPVTVQTFLYENPMTGFFEPTETLAVPVEVTVLEGDWPETGAVRRVRLSDGHYTTERILAAEPGLLRYQIWGLTSGAGRGVEQIGGEMRFLPDGRGTTRMEWDYNIVPRSFLAGLFVDRQVDAIDTWLETGLGNFAAAAATDG
ncbi:MAG: SRPBCC family protein, partial [Pseudomonadota bacterium]